MDVRSIIRKRLRKSGGVRVERDVNSAVASNVGRPGRVTVSESSSGPARPEEPEDGGRGRA